jgi:hypothetical protein
MISMTVVRSSGNGGNNNVDEESWFPSTIILLINRQTRDCVSEEGLLLAHHMGCNRVVIESDCSTTIEACIGEQRWHNESTTVYADCIDLVA